MARGVSTVGTMIVTTLVTSAAWLGFAALYNDRLFPCPSVPAATATQQSSAAANSGPARVNLPVTQGRTPVPAGALVIPVAGVKASQLVDTFDDVRSAGRVHDAIDIMAPRGTPVIAAAPGRVEKLFQSKAGGITAYLRSSDGRTIYYYAHLDQYAPGLREGASLAAGAPIGTVGFTGNASPTAPHLHFAVMQTTPDAKWYQPATAINPYPLLVGTSVRRR